MTNIFDDLAAIARERHFGHESELVSERMLCRITRIPVDWCHGCRKGFHKHTYQPLIGSEPDDVELPVAEVIPAEVTPVEVTPADATPPEVEAPTVKFTDVDLAAGPIEGVNKIWRDGELVYDADKAKELEQSLKDGVDHARDPNYCPRCTPQGWGSCQCSIASNE